MALAPVFMSLACLALIAASLVFHLEPLPIHDEGAIDHVGMLLLWGQVPVIAGYVFLHRREIGRIAARLFVQVLLFLAVIVAAIRMEQDARQAVAQRIAANRPLAGSETALRRIIEAEHPGQLQSLSFRGVDRIGWDIYGARLDDGEREWRIFVTADGKVAGVTKFDANHVCSSTEPYECR
jgi:hypothetical protein